MGFCSLFKVLLYITAVLPSLDDAEILVTVSVVLAATGCQKSETANGNCTLDLVHPVPIRKLGEEISLSLAIVRYSFCLVHVTPIPCRSSEDVACQAFSGVPLLFFYQVPRYSVHGYVYSHISFLI